MLLSTANKGLGRALAGPPRLASAPILAACRLFSRAALQAPRRGNRAVIARVVNVGSATQQQQQPKPAEQRPAAPVASFGELGLGPELQLALEQQSIQTPTEIQALAIPPILKGGNYLLASHTGSGKTLAYLLPLVQLLKQEEARDGFVSRPKRPRVLVLGPTKELVDQITRVAKSLCHTAKFRATSCSASTPLGMQRSALAAPVDVVVATPTRFAQHQEDHNVHVGDVRWLVLDEADTMFDQGFGPEVKKTIAQVRSKAQPANVLLVSATMTKAVKKLVAEELPGLVTLQTGTMHRAVAGSKHAFVSLERGQDKLSMLQDVIQADVRRGRKVLVFCGTVGSCRAVEHHCQERGVPTVCYHGDMPPAARKEAMAAFAGSSAGAAEPGSAASQAVMVCTDLAARGLDFPGTIDHVVNFDFPTTPVDYIHRTGRTARAGAPGSVTSLVDRRARVLAQRIEWALAHNEPLDQLSADKSVLPPSMQPKKADPSKLPERNTDRRPGSTTRRSGGGTSRSSSAAGKAGPGSGFSGAQAGSSKGAGGPGAAKGAPGSGAGKRMSKDEIMKERAKKAVEIKKIKVAKRLRLKGKAPKH